MSTFLWDRGEGASEERNLLFIPPEGLLGPDSVAWKINREGIVVLAQTTITLMLVAHPVIARTFCGVSNSGGGAWHVEEMTKFLRSVIFGSRRDLLRLVPDADRTYGSPSSAGSNSYSRFARCDQTAKMWVLGAYLGSTIAFYERFVGPLSDAEKAAYLQDIRSCGELIGLDRSFGPQGWDEFSSYYRSMMQDSMLGSDLACIDVARMVTGAETGRIGFVRRISRLLVNAMVPAPIRGRLGIESSVWSHGCCSIVEVALPLLSSVSSSVWKRPADYYRALNFWPKRSGSGWSAGFRMTNLEKR